ncbi:uncharacterized protein LOC135809647 isoform X1 [Sycon ciliatum]|uniref:uncharacterized protein LOC135809647 isoform X1 n=1 Tax=Sycon ciliatum TaxID=27933 RepID=UPI0031F67C34
MGDRMPQDNHQTGGGVSGNEPTVTDQTPVDNSYFSFPGGRQSSSSRRSERHTSCRPNDPFPSLTRGQRQSTTSTASVSKRKPQPIPRSAKSSVFPSVAQSRFFTNPEPGIIYAEADQEQEIYEEPISQPKGGYGSTAPSSSTCNVTGTANGSNGSKSINSTTPCHQKQQAGSGADEAEDGEEEDYGFCAASGSNPQWELVYKEADGEAPRTSKAKFGIQDSSTTQLLTKQQASKVHGCYFYGTSLTYTALMLVRCALFVALVVVGFTCVYKLGEDSSECVYVLFVASPVGSPSRARPARRITPNKPQVTSVTTRPNTLATAVPSVPTVSNVGDISTLRPPSPSGQSKHSQTLPSQTPTHVTVAVETERANYNRTRNAEQHRPTFSSIHAMWIGTSVLNSVLLCVFLGRNAQQIQIPACRMLFSRLKASKYFWTQLVLLGVSLVYDGRFLRDAYRNKVSNDVSPELEKVHAWVLAGRAFSILDKTLAFVVVCGFNYAKPFTIPRTRFYLKWMKAMYTLTLLIYVLDQGFSVIFDGMKVSMQAVTRGYGSQNITSGTNFRNDDSDRAIMFLLILFSIAYRTRLLEFFTDKIFYRNKDVFDIPRNTA